MARDDVHPTPILLHNPDNCHSSEQASSPPLLFDGLDYAVIGVDHKGNLVYDHYRMVEQFMCESDMTNEEAEEYISYNVLGVNAGEGFTIIYSFEAI